MEKNEAGKKNLGDKKWVIIFIKYSEKLSLRREHLYIDQDGGLGRSNADI